MGWTYQHAIFYKGKFGDEVDRKEECDFLFTGGSCRGHYEVLKSRMVGSTYYAAVKRLLRYAGDDESGNHTYEPIPEDEQVVTAWVIPTRLAKGEYCNFGYKEMTENVGPVYEECPESILKLLSPTEEKYAVEWRNNCRKHVRRKKEFSALPVGSVIEFTTRGRAVRVTKHAPAYQFKTPFWTDGEYYYPKARIPDSYEIISRGK